MEPIIIILPPLRERHWLARTRTPWSTEGRTSKHAHAGWARKDVPGQSARRGRMPPGSNHVRVGAQLWGGARGARDHEHRPKAGDDQRDDECDDCAPSLPRLPRQHRRLSVYGFVCANSQCIAGEKAWLQARDAVQRPHIHLRLPVHGHHESRSLRGCMRVDLCLPLT
jgi:hypothetical protein